MPFYPGMPGPGGRTLPADPIPGWGGSKTGGGTRGSPGGGSVATIPSGSPTNVTAFTATDQATVLPIAWGTCKIPAILIEKLAPLQTQPPAWSVNPVHIGEIWSSAGSAYECISDGNTSSAPSGSGSAPVAWAPSTTIPLVNVPVPRGSIRQSNGNVYRSLNSTTINTGLIAPVGSSADFFDGNVHWAFVSAMPITVVNDGTAVWKYLQQMPYPLYYQFFVAAVCEGEIVGIISTYFDKTQLASATGTPFLAHNMQSYVGPDAGGQLLVDPRFDASGYQHTAVVSTQVTTGAPSGTQAEIADLAFETQAVMFGRAVGVNPADILGEVLVHPRRGRAWDSSRVGSSVGGAGAASFRTWCDAKGIEISYLLDTARASLDVITDLMYGTNCISFMGQGQLEVVPLDDTAIPSPAIGAVGYVPALTASFSITPDDILEPVRFDRRKDADCTPIIPVEYINRPMGYVTDRVQNGVLSAIRKAGGPPTFGSPVTLPFIYPDGTIPIYLSRVYAQQSLYNRNTYTVKVGPKFLDVEPGDVGFIPIGDSIANYQLKPARVIQVDEDTPGGNWTLTCVESPAGAAGSVPYLPAKGDGVVSQAGLTTGSIATAYQQASQTNQAPDNYFPNGNSENSPPSYIQVADNGSSAEWDFRLNVGAGASFTASHGGGSMVVTVVASGSILPFQVVTGSGVPAACYVTSQVSGTPGGAGTYTISTGNTVTSRGMTSIGAYAGNYVRQFVGLRELVVNAPCSPGDRYALSVQHRRLDGVTGNSVIQVRYLDAAGNTTGSSPVTAASTSNLWQLLSVVAVPAPAGTVTAACLVLSSSSGGTLYQFDAFVFRRIVETPVIASGLVGQGLATDSTGATVWAGDSGWTAVTFAGTFANLGGAFATAAFRKDPNGYVHIKGIITSGTSGGTIFTLPTGYRPLETHQFAQKQTAGGVDGYAEISIQASGVVTASAYAATGNMTIDAVLLGEQ